MDWERSTEERSASSEISADYRLPPDPVSPPFFRRAIYIYIYIFPIYYWLLFILVSSLCSAFLYTYIYTYTIYWWTSRSFAIVGRSCALRMRRRSTAPSPFKLQLQLRVAVHYATSLLWPSHGGSFVTCYPVWRQTRLWSISSMHIDVLRFTWKSDGDRIRTYTRARTHACMCMCVEFTLHVGLLHVPKCFAVCCSPC